MSFFKKFPFCIVVFLLIAGSCKKDFIIIDGRPFIDEGAVLQILSPSDSAYYARNAEIELSATLTGDQIDYSFLELFVVEANTGDTLQTGSVSADGSIHFSWQNALAPGEYAISVVAVNKASRNEKLTSDAIHIFICIPPPVSITGLTKDETSITISWKKAAIENFKAYEILSVRTDTAPDLPPYPPGKLIAVISDINNTSFTDKEIYFYYKYAYVVRVVTEEDCGSISERKTIEAGSFIDLPAHTQTADVIFDRTRGKMYMLDNQNEGGARLNVYDPEMLSIEHSIPIDGDIVFTGMNENSSALNMVKRINANTFQLLSVDLNSFAVSDGEVFVLPVSSATIEGIFDKKALYSSFTETMPREGLLSLYDIVSTHDEIVRAVDTREATAIDDNSKFVINAANDSFFVYSFEGGILQLVAEERAPSLAYSYAHAVFSSTGKIAVGGNLYDKYFNLLYSLGNNEYFTGLSADGTYAATSNNEVYDISSSNVQLVKKYGDGFGTFPWFSNDNKTLYHLTEGSVNPKWNPGPRLFRYPFRD